MKKILTLILFVTILFVSNSNAQTHPVILSQNGVLYWVTGSSGVVFNADGTIDFVGEMTLTQLTPAEILALGEASPDNSGQIAAKIPCGADQALYGSPGTVVHFTQKKCGPITLTPLATGGKKATCQNQNDWLCSAKVPSETHDINYLNIDCNN
jgi:hypothetical protein